MNEVMAIRQWRLALCRYVYSAEDLPDKQPFDELNVISSVFVRTPPVIPLPVTSAEDLVCLIQSSAGYSVARTRYIIEPGNYRRSDLLSPSSRWHLHQIWLPAYHGAGFMYLDDAPTHW